MMRYLRIICCSLFALQGAKAENLSIDLDKAKTKISFVLTDVLHTVHGTFQLNSGHVVFNPDTGEIKGDLSVDAASGESGSAARDRRMTKDILEAQRYPEARFTATKLTGSFIPSGTSSVQVTGSFTIHGQAHELVIPMQVRLSQGEITATGKFTVPYVQWGMKNPGNFLLKVNDKVEVYVTAVGHLTGLPPKFP
ncbi:MAG TPA: YceI family protein [Bryobacteraceae bacterium]|jgi:polyisoprenoid-binding protein YceI